MDDYKDEADHSRSANILDATACGTNGLIPHGNPALVITGVATGVARRARDLLLPGFPAL